MKSRPVIATILALFVVTAALTVVHAAPIPASFQIDGDQLTITLHNPGSADVTVDLTVYQRGESLGTVTVSVPAASISTTVWTINDDVTPFGLSVGLAVQSTLR